LPPLWIRLCDRTRCTYGSRKYAHAGPARPPSRCHVARASAGNWWVPPAELCVHVLVLGAPAGRSRSRTRVRRPDEPTERESRFVARCRAAYRACVRTWSKAARPPVRSASVRATSQTVARALRWWRGANWSRCRRLQLCVESGERKHPCNSCTEPRGAATTRCCAGCKAPRLLVMSCHVISLSLSRSLSLWYQTDTAHI
jgi:hypothetical protein